MRDDVGLDALRRHEVAGEDFGVGEGGLEMAAGPIGVDLDIPIDAVPHDGPSIAQPAPPQSGRVSLEPLPPLAPTARCIGCALSRCARAAAH